MDSRRHILFMFVGRNKGGDEENPIKFQSVPHLFSCSQMAVVHGVECSAEDTEFL